MTLTLDFQAHGATGHVHVEFGVSPDQAELGFGALGLHIPVEQLQGFPYVEASVEYPRKGYFAEFGWLQVVRFTAPDGDVFLVDTAPQFQAAEVRLPFLSWGPRPTLFDAPATASPDVDWWADAFLVATPDLLMTPVIEPLLAFRWGYEVDGDSRITPREPRRRDTREAWDEIRERVAAEFPAWELR